MSSIRGKHRLSGTPGSLQSAPGPICSELPIETTDTARQRGGSCLHVSRNRHKIGRGSTDSTDSTYYPKTLKKRFPITFPFGYDPFNADSDGDGVKDSQEDYDRDLLTNALEIKRGLNPGHNLADLNNDDKFSKEDVTLFNSYYKFLDARADVNGDGKINSTDKTVFQKAYDNELKYR